MSCKVFNLVRHITLCALILVVRTALQMSQSLCTGHVGHVTAVLAQHAWPARPLQAHVVVVLLMILCYNLYTYYSHLDQTYYEITFFHGMFAVRAGDIFFTLFARDIVFAMIVKEFLSFE